MTDSNLPRQIIGAAITVHRDLGPGLLEQFTKNAFATNWVLSGFNSGDRNLSSDLSIDKAGLWQ
jgi:hypothetical protein